MSTNSREVGRTYPIPGYIFIGEPREGAPEPYLAEWHGEWGFFARLTHNHFSGAFPVPLVEYLRAAAAHEAFVASANELGDLSEQLQAIQHEVLKQLGVDPTHASIQAMADAAARTIKRKMLVHARYEAAKNAWEDATRDVQTTEQLQAREQAFADALERMKAASPRPVARPKKARNVMH
jgi:hypothetical protein